MSALAALDGRAWGMKTDGDGFDIGSIDGRGHQQMMLPLSYLR